VSELLERRERTLVRLLLLGHLLLGMVRLLLLGHLLLGGHCARGKLPNVVHHGSALLRRGHCHGELLSKLCRRLLPCILRWVVGDGRPLLLLLLAIGGGVRPVAEGRIVLFIPAGKLPIMLARVAFGLWMGPRLLHIALVWPSLTSPPCMWQ
jgi:hypothetical protein